MANYEICPYEGALVENTKINIHKLYLRQFSSGPEKNQLVIMDGYGPNDLGMTSAINWVVYDGVGSDAKLVAHVQGVRMKAGGNWYNSFIMVFESERFKGSTLEILGATVQEEGEWAIVGGTGDFAMARGIVQRKMAEKRADGETIELTIDVFCRMKMSTTFRIHCQANADLSLAIKNGVVILTKTNPSDDSQVWWKHVTSGGGMSDVARFVLVNKSTGEALKDPLVHALKNPSDTNNVPLQVIKFDQGHLDESLQWTESGENQGGFRIIRSINNANYILDAEFGGMVEGTRLIVFEPNGGTNQLWQVSPLNDTPK